MATKHFKYIKKVLNKETGRTKTVKYGDDRYSIAPGTSKGDSYCARSYGIKQGLSEEKKKQILGVEVVVR